MVVMRNDRYQRESRCKPVEGKREKERRRKGHHSRLMRPQEIRKERNTSPYSSESPRIISSKIRTPSPDFHAMLNRSNWMVGLSRSFDQLHSLVDQSITDMVPGRLVCRILELGRETQHIVVVNRIPSGVLKEAGQDISHYGRLKEVSTIISSN